MKLVQIFLPLYDNKKHLFPKYYFDNICNQLKDQFGGVSFYRNATVEGLWEDDTGKTNYDELIIAEVMIEAFNKNWWQYFKQDLEKTFKQDEILIRTMAFDKI